MRSKNEKQSSRRKKKPLKRLLKCTKIFKRSCVLVKRMNNPSAEPSVISKNIRSSMPVSEASTLQHALGPCLIQNPPPNPPTFSLSQVWESQTTVQRLVEDFQTLILIWKAKMDMS